MPLESPFTFARFEAPSLQPLLVRRLADATYDEQVEGDARRVVLVSLELEVQPSGDPLPAPLVRSTRKHVDRLAVLVGDLLAQGYRCTSEGTLPG